MSTSFQQKVLVSSNSEKAFKALTQELHKWWGEVDKVISGNADVFSIFFDKAFWKFGVTNYEPNKALVWRCIGGEPEWNKEWIGTTLFWEIKDLDDQVEISFLHEGLVPEFRCYEACSLTWIQFITQSLKTYLETGKGEPHISSLT